jgi:hypothetical protein
MRVSARPVCPLQFDLLAEVSDAHAQAPQHSERSIVIANGIIDDAAERKRVVECCAAVHCVVCAQRHDRCRRAVASEHLLQQRCRTTITVISQILSNSTQHHRTHAHYHTHTRIARHDTAQTDRTTVSTTPRDLVRALRSVQLCVCLRVVCLYDFVRC